MKSSLSERAGAHPVQIQGFQIHALEAYLVWAQQYGGAAAGLPAEQAESGHTVGVLLLRQDAGTSDGERISALLSLHQHAGAGQAPGLSARAHSRARNTAISRLRCPSQRCKDLEHLFMLKGRMQDRQHTRRCSSPSAHRQACDIAPKCLVLPPTWLCQIKPI